MYVIKCAKEAKVCSLTFPTIKVRKFAVLMSTSDHWYTGVIMRCLLAGCGCVATAKC